MSRKTRWKRENATYFCEEGGTLSAQNLVFENGNTVDGKDSEAGGSILCYGTIESLDSRIVSKKFCAN